MKENPNTSQSPRLHYLVTLDSQEYHTYARSPSSAISNAAYHYAQAENLPVALVRWKIAKGDIYSEVELQDTQEDKTTP